MTSPQVNIIKKQVVELDISSNAAVFSLQQQAQEWCSRQLLPALEFRLERYASMPEVICIDELLIEINGSELNDKLVQQIGDELESKLQQQGNWLVQKKEKRFLDLFIFYLEHGHLPWWNNINSRISFEEELHQWIKQLALPADIAQLKNILSGEKAAKRLLSVLPAKHQWLLFEKLLGSAGVHEIGDAIVQLESTIAHYTANLYINTPAPFHQLFVSIMNEALLKWIVYGREKIFPLGIIAARTLRHAGYSAEVIKKIFSETNLKESRAFDVTYHHAFSEPVQAESLPLTFSPAAAERKNSGEREKQPQLQTVDEGIYISNAGLVLAARYFNDFFERTGLRQDKQFVHPALAVAALQWMATGSEEPAEFELVLPKILCGMELEKPLPQVKGIPAFMKQEAHELLESLIKHWGILKNTSVEGLRASFLQRQGKLSRVNDHWLLQVEQKSYDMLLEHLPWTISIIKLSFMKDAMYVEW